MPTRIATALSQGSPQEAGSELARQVKSRLGADQPVLLMAFASTSQPLEPLSAVLRAEFPNTLLLTSSTSGEFVESRDAKDSAAVFALAGDYKVFAGIGTGLARNAEGAVGAAVKDLPTELAGYPHRTGILLLDPLAGVSEEATLITGALLGAETPLAGGAAGDDLQMKTTHVGLDSRVATDAVVVAVIFSKAPLGVGVCHGHTPLSAHLRVTKASGNVVHTIDGRPAWDVWQERTRESAAKRGEDPSKLKDAEVGAYLLRYEAALDTGTELKIRAPLSRAADGSISFACGIPEGASIRITESVPARQVESAAEAARRAKTQLQGATPAGAVVFDCICRNLILGSEFKTAVNTISRELGNVPIAGFETYGEIALVGGDMSGFHNTTTVVLAFPV